VNRRYTAATPTEESRLPVLVMHKVFNYNNNNNNNNNNSVALVRERTIPTERPPLVSEVLRIEWCRVVSAADPHGHVIGFLDHYTVNLFRCASNTHNFFLNPLLFASCTNTFSKLCKITRGMKRSAQ
jgi:hypothetical protein